jgi:hypothetical protein
MREIHNNRIRIPPIEPYSIVQKGNLEMIILPWCPQSKTVCTMYLRHSHTDPESNVELHIEAESSARYMLYNRIMADLHLFQFQIPTRPFKKIYTDTNLIKII